MNYQMPKWLAFFVRTFPGIKPSVLKFSSIKNSECVMFDGVKFPFDHRLMDKKRFVAVAAGAVEMDEISVAKKYISSSDVVVELGAGIGVAAARINRIIKPKKHICFEANPSLIPYLQNLFKINNMDISIKNMALGSNKKLKFYALNDYILSSFIKPKNRNDFIEIEVNTISCQKIIDHYLPTAIFCDVEGAELEYFDAKNFKNVKTIVIELHPNIYGSEGVEKVSQRFKSHGFAKSHQIRYTYCFTK